MKRPKNRRAPRGGYARRMTTVIHEACTPAHISASGLGCRLRTPPEVEKGQTVTQDEYETWDEADVARLKGAP